MTCDRKYKTIDLKNKNKTLYGRSYLKKFKKIKKKKSFKNYKSGKKYLIKKNSFYH